MHVGFFIILANRPDTRVKSNLYMTHVKPRANRNWPSPFWQEATSDYLSVSDSSQLELPDLINLCLPGDN